MMTLMSRQEMRDSYKDLRRVALAVAKNEADPHASWYAGDELRAEYARLATPLVVLSLMDDLDAMTRNKR